MTRGRKAIQRAAASAGAIGTLALLLAAFAVTPALAIGGGGNVPAPRATPSAKCGSGWYWSKRCGACARICPRGHSYSCSRKRCYKRRRGELSDDELYREAVSLIESEHYRAALDLLWAIEKREVPKVLNYIGYSTRKLGDVEEGIKYYKKALALDPNYNVAREYLGEGYLQKGDLAKAKQQLAEIEARCGKACHAYEELAKEIVQFESEAKSKTLAQ